MIRIAIFDDNSYLLNNSKVSDLQRIDFAAMDEFDRENLSAWLAKHGGEMLAPHLPNEDERPAVNSHTNPEMLNRNEQTCWRLNASQLEMISPCGETVLLSHNECCILRAVVKANRNLVSRKMLIEALGQDVWHYDERRLESLISRLRRKLASYAPEDISIRGVKGQGYLFKFELQLVEA